MRKDLVLIAFDGIMTLLAYWGMMLYWEKNNQFVVAVLAFSCGFFFMKLISSIEDSIEE